jgi:hypothetical protein
MRNRALLQVVPRAMITSLARRDPALPRCWLSRSGILFDRGLPDRGVCEDFASLTSALVCGEILPADVTECHGGPEGGAGAGIAAAEDGGRVVADGEQARDRLSLDIENARA